MDSINYENQILNAIETIVNNTVENAGYDKTIQARILERTNDGIGEYKVRYQDSTFYAYAADVNIKYVKDTLVYVLVPNNDMNQIKTIISAVDKDNVEYVEVLETEDFYDKVGGNAINFNNQSESWSLCSYKASDSKYIYIKNDPNNKTYINDEWFALQLKNLYNIIGGAYFKTTLPAEQRTKGVYGIAFEFKMRDESDPDKTYNKEFVLDINNMEGNPYNYINFMRQEKIYNINPNYFVSVESIRIYSNNFPETRIGEPDDIFVMVPFLYAAKEIPEAERNGYTVKLEATKNFFRQDDPDTETVINSSIKIRGREPSPERIFQYYWFKENLEIFPTMAGYSSYGGSGWECINDYNILDQDDQGHITQIEYITNKSSITIQESDCTLLENKYKLVVVISDESSVEDTISIMNYNDTYNFIIDSDLGYDFFYGNGYPTLTAKMEPKNPEEQNTWDPNNYTYKWVKIDNNNVLTSLPETDELNEEYETAETNYYTLLNAIETAEKMPNAAASELADYKATLDNLNQTQRVEKNIIHTIPVNTEIDDYADYKCSYYSNNQLIGIATVRLTNHAAIEGEYFLNIINGNKTFNYSAEGIAPNHNSLNNKLNLMPLSFEIIDSNGHPLPERMLNHCNIQWSYPTEDTLLVIDPNQSTSELTFNYDIASIYDINKLNNNIIKLNVQYQQLNLYAESIFGFVKDGDPGSNGTGIICKIVPNIDNPEEFDEYPMMLYDKGGNFKKFNFIPKNFNPESSTNKYFQVQLWQDGKIIWQGYTTQSSAGITNVEWSNLKRYKDVEEKAEDPYRFLIDNDKNKAHIKMYSGGSCSVYPWDCNISAENQFPLDIICVKVTYNNINYFTTLPIISAQLDLSGETEDWNNPNLSIKLLKNTGFNYVAYDSNGKNPSYSNIDPFTLKVECKLGNYWEDVSNLWEYDGIYKTTYEWLTQASIFYDDEWHLQETLREEIVTDPSDNNKNWHFYVPVDDFNGEVLNTGILVNVHVKARGEEAVDQYTGRIHIPIHYYLNRYGLTAVNDWDGNSIKIDDEEGIILSPQVGAGHKNDDNSFTGVLIGSVKEGSQQNTEDGLFGYYKGQRSIFLDANTGKAEFGTIGRSRIILDPTDEIARIYSGNYSLIEYEQVSGTYKAGVIYYRKQNNDYVQLIPTTAYVEGDYNINDKIEDSNIYIKINDGSGLWIDLTTPEIRYGNDNFSVDKNGFLVARGGGSIAGWEMNDYTLTKEAGIASRQPYSDYYTYKYKIQLSSKPGISDDYAFSIEDLTVQEETVSQPRYPFYIKNNGIFFAQGMRIAGGVLDDNRFIKGSLNVGPSFDNWGDKESNGYNFIVDSTGHMIVNNKLALNPEYRPGIDPPDQKYVIGGGAEIISCIIKNGKTEFNEWKDGLYLGLEGISTGKNNSFQVTTDGSITSTKGTIAGWTIHPTYLSSGTDDSFTYVGISSDSTERYALWAGREDPDNASFKLDKNGSLTTENSLFITASMTNPVFIETSTNNNITYTKTYTFSSTEHRINEIPRIYSGPDAPGSSLGQNGDIYIRY